MSIDRRVFLLSGMTAAVSVAAGSRVPLAEEPAKKTAALRLCSQNWIIPGKSLEEQLAKMKAWGCEGAELPGKIVGEEKRYAKALDASGLAASAVCWGSCGGALVSESPEKRKEGRDKLRRVLESAGELKSTGVIYVPEFHGQTKLENREIRKILVDTFPELGEHAVQCGTRILFEPLNRNECFFLRQLADAAAICRDINNPGVQMMGDLYHMGIEETSDLGAILSAGDSLRHVHLASRTRVLPGQDDRTYVDAFRGLKYVGFDGYCSFECGIKGDPEVEIPKSLAFLRDQWEQATPLEA
ncbi:MAG: sugar phosphate isomerase/epimerase [Pirellulaceae bacterium]|nr:sugar phosphate isomerase/epimerase [Pirellulaceae bacterium]